LEGTVDPSWAHEQTRAHIRETFGISEEWAEWLALMYGQRLGRKPVGVTKDAGVEIGVRRTLAADRERLWSYLLSPAGLALWIGSISVFRPEKGFGVYVSGRRIGKGHRRLAPREAAHDVEAP